MRMFSAISFGVFCRSAPSTSAIIRSRNVSPGLDVMRTTIRSDSTLVPPVTAERSPPLSRMTGPDSPVIADSSTEATPSITSPSPGISSPASTTTRSPARSAVAFTTTAIPSVSRRALVCVRIRRNESACALPRPSATASAKFANTTVNQSQNETPAVNQSGAMRALPATRARKKRRVVSTLPTSTTNITGFLATSRGDSLTKLSLTARLRMSRSNRAGDFAAASMSVALSGHGREVFGDRSEGQRREERQRADDENHRDEQRREQRAVGGEGAGPGRDDLLAQHRPRDRHHRDDHQEPAREHREAERRVVER